MPALALVESIGLHEPLVMIVEDPSEADVLDTLLALLDGSARPPDLARLCAALRARMLPGPGQWARALSTAEVELRVFSIDGRATGSSGGARAAYTGSVGSACTYRVALTTAAEAWARLERELLAAWLRDRAALGRGRGPAPWGWSSSVALETSTVTSVRLVTIA